MNKQNLSLLLILLINPLLVIANSKRDFEVCISGSQEIPRILACKAPEFSFHLPQMAGNFRIGISNGKDSRWGDELKNTSLKNEKGKLTYTLQDPFMGKGSLIVKVVKLSDSDGIIAEIEAKDMAEGTCLIWSFGGCYGKVLEDFTQSKMEPHYCKDNVFSIERTSFTTYYGESMRLKTIHGITPFESDIRLSDAHHQDTPLALYESGKKTDAPALAASCPLLPGKKLYFCLYTQNKKADYNYYMLPALFEKEFNP